jgi:IMP dehydrogenase
MLKHKYDDKLFCFDDLILKPAAFSAVESRSQVNTEVKITKNDKSFIFSNPIISSPMSNVTDVEMCLAMTQVGSMSILHRFDTFESLEKKIKLLTSFHKETFVAVAIGVQEQDYINLPKLIDLGVNAICIDVAFAANIKTMKFIEYAKKLTEHTSIFLITGSISSVDQVLNFIEHDLESDMYRVGIGGGSICTTTIQTGHGTPLASSLFDFHINHDYLNNLLVLKNKKKFHIIADGGIRNSGDIVKAIALGADFVMCGSLLSSTTESPGETVERNGKLYKKYFGMASLENQKNKENAYEEGVSHLVEYKGSVKNIIKNLMNGVRSGCSYSNAFNLKELREKAVIDLITKSSVSERKPHIFDL